MLRCLHSALVGIGRLSTNLMLLLLSRQIVARGLLDVLREFSDNENDFISVMETVARMSEDGGRCIFCFIHLVVMSLDNSALRNWFLSLLSSVKFLKFPSLNTIKDSGFA